MHGAYTSQWWIRPFDGDIWRFNGLAVLLQVGVARLDAEGDRHLGCKVPVWMVPKLKFPHVPIQRDILLVLDENGQKQRGELSAYIVSSVSISADIACTKYLCLML